MGEADHSGDRSGAHPRLPETSAEDGSEGSLRNVVHLVGRFRQIGSSAIPAASWSLPFLTILAIATLIYLASFWLDVLTTARGAYGEVSFDSLVQTVLFQDLEQARNTLGGLGEVMAAVLGLALTVSSIIVQLAATRFTPHITSLFFRAPANLMILGFFVTSSVYVLWVNFTVGELYLSRWGVLFSMLLMTASLLLLFPYFAYVFDFLDPEKIVGRIMNDGLGAATPTRGRMAAQAIEARQARAVEAVEHLANIGLNALQQKDKGIASGSVDALCEFGIRYGDSKVAMRREWHAIPDWMRQSPDFVSLTEEAVGDLHNRGTWLEWKILRQYQMLFGEGLNQIKDTCYLVAIDTRRLGEASGRRGDTHALDLTIKFFNTYLRATINASDIRTAYNILHQYRQLGEFVLIHGRELEATAPADDKGLAHRALQIAKFMRYYSAICYQRGLTFITEVIAHDIGTLCEVAFNRGAPGHEELLQVFLSVDEHAETQEQEKTLRGVRRAQIKLATTYLVNGATEYAQEIWRDMKDEPLDRLRSIWHELQGLDTREFWEVNDRGTNFDYLTPAQKRELETYFAWFEGLESNGPENRRTLSSLLP